MSDQGFTKPSRNAANWDVDLNANLTIQEKGYFVNAQVGPVSVNTGQLVTFNGSGLIVPLSGGLGGSGLAGTINATGTFCALALNVTSPGNTGYFLARGQVSSFSPWSGQIPVGGAIHPSVFSLGWVTNSLFEGAMISVGRCLRDGEYFIEPIHLPNINHGIVSQSANVHCASGTLGAWSFTAFVGKQGIFTALRVTAQSCDNWRVTLYSNSGRTTKIYETAVTSGNIGVTTRDLIDNATFPYSLNPTTNSWGLMYGYIEVLSSAFTAINSNAFSIGGAFWRFR